MKEVKTITIEYDDEGRVVKQTVTTEHVTSPLTLRYDGPSASYRPTHGGYPDVPVKVVHQGSRPARRSSGLGFI